ncbi:DMT family transporter [Motiliproteus sp.]|uniref:DMT family transporter n=1 Tax=Motiliproteus sp. TaxID=1898955 RepID=UPI003BAB451B
MSTPLSLLLVAALGGIAITVQGQLMGVMDRQLGTLESVFLTYVIGAACIALVMLVYRGGNLGQWQQLPWWTLTAGLVGLVIVGSIGYSVSRLGVVSAFILITAAQFIAAALIDQFGWFGAEVRPIDSSKLLGIGAMMLGVWLTLK